MSTIRRQNSMNNTFYSTNMFVTNVWSVQTQLSFSNQINSPILLVHNSKSRSHRKNKIKCDFHELMKLEKFPLTKFTTAHYFWINMKNTQKENRWLLNISAWPFMLHNVFITKKLKMVLSYVCTCDNRNFCAKCVIKYYFYVYVAHMHTWRLYSFK